MLIPSKKQFVKFGIAEEGRDDWNTTIAKKRKIIIPHNKYYTDNMDI